MTHPGGRPSKYLQHKPEGWQALIEEYFKTCVDLWDKESKMVDVNLPMVEGLGLYLGLSNETLYQWAKDKKEFSDAIKEIKRMQKQKLVESGLSGAYNGRIAELMLSANHSVFKKTEVDQNLSGSLTLKSSDVLDDIEAQNRPTTSGQELEDKKPIQDSRQEG